MTKGLPATLEAAVESAAVAHARRHVCRLKSGEISAQPLELRDSEGAAAWSWFGGGNSRTWTKARLKALAVIPQRASFVCGLARDGVSVADEALREIIVEHKERDQKLSTSLRAYDIEITQGMRRRQGGRDTTEVVLRNLAIVSVVAYVCEAFGLPPTRSRASQRHGLSGCYIAARALEQEREAISESAIVKAWTRYGFLHAPEA
jgi:hypothetical protein